MRTTTQRITVALALTLSVAAAACGEKDANPVMPTPPAAPDSGTQTIDVAENNGPNSFYPSPARVSAGQAVVWRNDDREAHDVAFDNGAGGTGRLAPGTLSQPITLGPGTWTYHCNIHPTMTGTLTVGETPMSSGGGGDGPGY
jgi:plastocyanin